MDKPAVELIDELITTNIKVYMLNDKLSDKDDKVVADAGRKMVKLMQKRSDLRNALAKKLGDNFDEVKNYEDSNRR